MASTSASPERTVAEIERTREELGPKVDALVGRAKTRAAEFGKKAAIGLAIGALAVGALLLLKRRRSRD